MKQQDRDNFLLAAIIIAAIIAATVCVVTGHGEAVVVAFAMFCLLVV